MGIYACPRCGNPNGWWSGNMQDVHDCPGPPRREWPLRPEYPPPLDWSGVDDKPADGAALSSPSALPEFDRDTDGELLIDWSPAKGRMVSLSLRADGRLSYAITWDGEQTHGTAQMPPARGVEGSKA